MQCSSHPNINDFWNSWAEQHCRLYFTLCFSLITWSSEDDPSAFGQGSYFKKKEDIFHKDESHTFNQAVLMICYNFGDWTKSPVVLMSCEDFDYSKKWSQHHCILYPWISFPVWMTYTYFKLMGTGIRYGGFLSPCVPGFLGFDSLPSVCLFLVLSECAFICRITEGVTYKATLFIYPFYIQKQNL